MRANVLQAEEQKIAARIMIAADLCVAAAASAQLGKIRTLVIMTTNARALCAAVLVNVRLAIHKK